MLVQKAINDYLDWKATYTNKAPLSYRLGLQRFSEMAPRKVEDIKVEHVIKFQQHLQVKYSAAHVAYTMIIVKNFIGYFKKQGYKCIDPSLVKIQKFTAKSHAHVTLEEFEKMDNSIRPNTFANLQRKVAIQLLWYCGMRVSELCDMNVAQVDSKFCRSLIKNKKNRFSRWLFWPPATHKLLMEFMEQRMAISDSPALFIGTRNEAGDRISIRQIQRWIKDIAKKAGVVKKISPHSFRHGRAHHIIAMGGNVVDVQKILGHSDTNPVASFHYLKLNPNEIERRAKKWF